MKKLPAIVGGLLGLAFIAFSLMFFLHLGPTPPAPPEGSPAALFMGAFYPTGYLSFVKALELIGGLLVAIPLTRNFGLLILGPILVNIIAFHIFIAKGADLFSPPIIALSVFSLYLLWADRRKWLNLLNCSCQCSSSRHP